MRVHITAAVLLLLAQTAAAGNKSAGNMTVLGDASDLAAGAVGQAGGAFVLDGALGGAAYGISGAAGTDLESGFYSRMVAGPSAFDYASVSTAGYVLAWSAVNPQGTLYEIFGSTWAQADPYMVYYSTDQNGYPVETLAPNTSFYNFVLANYMEGDYSPLVSTTAVTLAAAPSSGTFTLADAGHNTLNLSFAGFENPPPVSGSQWAAGAALPASRYGQASVVYGSHVFISGGFNGVAFSSAVYRGAIGAGGEISAWPAAGFMPAARYGHQLVAARGRLYLLGGYDAAGSHAEVWSADISTDGVLGAWEPELPLPDPVYFHAAVFGGGRIIVTGGYRSGSGVLASVCASAPGDDGTLAAWSTSPFPLPAPRYSHTLTVVGGDRLYAAGGKDGASARGEVWSAPLDPSTGLPSGWSAGTPLPSPRYGHRTLAAANRLYVIGGSNGSSAQAQVFQATVSANAAVPAVWQAYSPLPAARQLSAAELAGGRIYVFGGSDGSLARDTVFTSALSGTQYLLEVSPDPGFLGGVRSSDWSSSPDASFDGLDPSRTYHFRAKARNWSGLETAYSPAGSTITYAAVPGSAPWTSVFIGSATANWLAAGNPVGYAYQLLYSTSPDFFPAAEVQTAGTSAVLDALSQSTTYYAKVRVFDALGRRSRFMALPPARTTFDPALDVASPTVTDNQADFTAWQSTNTFGCDVDFADPAGGSGLAMFEVQAATDPGGAAGIVQAWQPAAAGITQNSYTQDWRLPQAAWEAIPEGVTAYISVRVFDNVANSAQAFDVFSVLKDTTPPSIGAAYSAPPVWYTDYPGDVSGLRFTDAVSGLYSLQYSVSSNKNFADASVIPWTPIAGLVPGSTYYEPVLSYSFNQLANAASNYFSFRAVDLAGSTSTLVDAFGIGKNVSGPTVIITTPSASYLSAFSGVSGNTAETNGHAVLGTGVSLRNLSSGLYYNAGSFLSGSRVWHDAQDASGGFSIAFGGIVLANGVQYQTVARSSDSAGDYSQLYATYTFIFDSQPPAAHILYPADGSSADSVSYISGTAADPVSGVSAVDVAFQRLSDGKWWNNGVSSWGAVPQALQAGTTPYWTWNFNNYLRDSLVHGASYYVSARASDASAPVNTGNFGVYGATFTYYDATRPPQTTTLTAAPGAFSGSVELYWRTAGDNGATGYLLNGLYKIAYSTYTGAQVSTASAQITITTATLTAGSTQLRLVTGLEASASYYFTLWTADDALNWSPPSNEASAVSGAPDSGSLTGNVSDGAGQPVTGVLVEALGPSGAVEGGDYTDIYGNYSIQGLDPLYLTIRAVWSAQDIESSVSKDGVPNGSAGVNFRLSVAYQLASISGTIPAGFIAKTAGRAVPQARYTTREVPVSSGGPAFVEIYRRGRRIGAAFTDAGGGFEVPNLLPGTYGLRVYNGSDYSRMASVTLRPGERLVFIPKFDLLNKDNVFAYPNPASSVVHFHFAPSVGAFEAEVEVFDVAGRLIKTLKSVSDDPAPGSSGGKRISWNIGREKIASGVYLYILRVRDVAGGTAEKVIKKFAVIR